VRTLRGLGGRELPCGCQIGLYGSQGKTRVWLVDAVGTNCPDPTHRVNALLTIADLARIGSDPRLSPPTKDSE
jgi:hypothetical protein